MNCDHIYGFHSVEGLITEDNYEEFYDLFKFTYCPFCRVQLHTLDKEQLPLGLGKEDDCIKGGCED